MSLQNGVGWGSVPFYSPFFLDLRRQCRRQEQASLGRVALFSPMFLCLMARSAFEYGCTSDRRVRDNEEEGAWGRGRA